MVSDMYWFSFFFFNYTSTTEIYTLSLHDALPISFGVLEELLRSLRSRQVLVQVGSAQLGDYIFGLRSEEHTSELQSQSNLVCRLLLEKKKKNNTQYILLYL